jgi:hypothetical protein
MAAVIVVVIVYLFCLYFGISGQRARDRRRAIRLRSRKELHERLLHD